MSRYQGGGRPPQEPQEPVELPPHIRHGGSTAYHAPYRCRCELCLMWRRSYDSARDRGVRSGAWRPAKRGRSPWYVCVDEDSDTYDWHQYNGARCIRCGADKQVEEFWEARWKAGNVMIVTIWVYSMLGYSIDAAGTAYVQHTASTQDHNRRPEKVEARVDREFHQNYPGYTVTDSGWKQQSVEVAK